MNLTIASNAVATGQVLGAPGVAAGVSIANQQSGSLNLRNSLLATATTNGNVWGPIIDAGHNISSDDTPGFDSSSSLNGTNPLLGPPSDNGGFTLTLALLPGSPALDAGTLEGAPTVDQRGAARPSGSAPDIGAYEFSAPALKLACWLEQKNFALRIEVPAGMQCQLQYRSPEQDSWTDLELFDLSPQSRSITRSYSMSADCRLFRLYSP